MKYRWLTFVFVLIYCAEAVAPTRERDDSVSTTLIEIAPVLAVAGDLVEGDVFKLFKLSLFV